MPKIEEGVDLRNYYFYEPDKNNLIDLERPLLPVQKKRVVTTTIQEVREVQHVAPVTAERPLGPVPKAPLPEKLPPEHLHYSPKLAVHEQRSVEALGEELGKPYAHYTDREQLPPEERDRRRQAFARALSEKLEKGSTTEKGLVFVALLGALESADEALWKRLDQVVDMIEKL